jgi:hypothetical protein
MKLSKVFAAVEPEFVLGTTYTLSLAFFESVVFSHINRRHLKRCLLLCDSHGLEMAMSEAPALQYAARDYMVATAPSPGTFHAKVWVLLSKDEMLLLVGSGNLTQPGFIENIELFDVVRVKAGSSGRELTSDVLDFLRGLAGLWRGTSDPNLLAVQTLRDMISVTAGLEAQLAPSLEPHVRFLSSFKGDFPTQFAALRPDIAYVAAPYFGNSSEGLERLQSTLGTRRTFVFPAIHRDGKLDLPVMTASRIRGVKLQSLSLAAAHPNKLTHLKLYGLQATKGQAWLFTSSVNCTLAALEGPNVEAGLLRRVAGDDLHAYFEATDLTSEESGSHISVQSSKTAWLIMWATDMGDQISIELAPICHAKIPLTNVRIELKSAQRTASIELPQVFTRAGTERVAWRHFGEFRSQLRNAAVLRVTATDACGRAVAGQCLVDDFATLTSDPVHRSAWRAAVALLGAEGMPDYADVAALFSLADVAAADDESDGELEDVPEATKRVAGSTKDAKREKAGVWPPTPLLDDAVSTGHYGHGAGTIYWFNRILATFLSRTASDPNNADGATEITDAGDEEGANNRGKASTDTPAETTAELSRAATPVVVRGSIFSMLPATCWIPKPHHHSRMENT